MKKVAGLTLLILSVMAVAAPLFATQPTAPIAQTRQTDCYGLARVRWTAS